MVNRQQKSQGRRRREYRLARRTTTTFTTYHVDRVLHMEEEVLVEGVEDILRGTQSFRERT